MDETLTTDPPAGTEGGAGSRRWMLLGAVVAAAVVVAVVLSLRSASEGSVVGAASSADAVNGLAAALADEDVVAAAAMLPPSEIGHAIDLYERVIELARKEGALAGDDPLAGIDLQASGLAIRVDQLHERVHKVYLEDGTVGITVDPAAMDAKLAEGAEAVDESITLAEVNRGLAEEAAGYEPGGLFDVRPPSELFVMAVHERGRWFVSPLYTSFEYLRTVLDLPPVAYDGGGIELPAGAATPSGVLEPAVAAVNDFDLDATVDQVLEQFRAGSLMPDLTASWDRPGAVPIAPDELRVLLDHLPMFQSYFEELDRQVDEAMAQIAEDGTDPMEMFEQMLAEFSPTLDLELEVATTEEVLDHERTKVVVADLALRVDGSVTLPEGAGAAAADATLTIRGTCAVVDYLAELPGDGRTERTTGRHEGCLEDAVPGLGVDGLFLVTRQIDGAHYVSPVETVVEYLAVVLDAALSGAFDDLDLGDVLEAPLAMTEVLEGPMASMAGEEGEDHADSSSLRAESSSMPAAEPAALADECRAGDPGACDWLWDNAEPGSDDERLASGCGDPDAAVGDEYGWAFGACAGDPVGASEWAGSPTGDWAPYEDCMYVAVPDDDWSSSAYAKAARECLPMAPEDAQADLATELERMEELLPYQECVDGYIAEAGDVSWSLGYTRGMVACIDLAPDEMQEGLAVEVQRLEAMLPYEECFAANLPADADEWGGSDRLEAMRACIDLAPEDEQQWLREQIAYDEVWAPYQDCLSAELGGLDESDEE